MALTASPSLATVLAAATTKEEWTAALNDALGTAKRISCSQTIGETTTEFRNVAISNVATADGTALTISGKASGSTVKLAADLTQGTSTLRVEGAGYWIEGSLGLSGTDFIAAGSFTENNGFALSSIAIAPPPSLNSLPPPPPVGGEITVMFGTSGSPQTVTIAEQLYADMPTGFAGVTQKRWRSNPITVPGVGVDGAAVPDLTFTVFPGIDSNGRADVWVYADFIAQGATDVNDSTTFSRQRDRADVSLSISINGVPQDLWGEGTTYHYTHQRATWLRWQSANLPWKLNPADINALIIDGTLLKHDNRSAPGARVALQSTATAPPDDVVYKPYKSFTPSLPLNTYIGDTYRPGTEGAERINVGIGHDWFGLAICEVGTNSNTAWLTAEREKALRASAEAVAQVPISGGVLANNVLIDPAGDANGGPYCCHLNRTTHSVATSIHQPAVLSYTTYPNERFYNFGTDQAHLANKSSYPAYAVSKDPWHLFQVQAAAIFSLTVNTGFNSWRGADMKRRAISPEQERSFWIGISAIARAWKATPEGVMPKPFRSKAFFKEALDNTFAKFNEAFIAKTVPRLTGVTQKASDFWRFIGPLGVQAGYGSFSPFQCDYGHVALAEMLLMGYSGARSTAEWFSENAYLRGSGGGNWWNEDRALTSVHIIVSDNAQAELPYTTRDEYRAWYPFKTEFVNGSSVPFDKWGPVTGVTTGSGRDTYLYLGALNLYAEAQRRGLITLHWDADALHKEVLARLVPPYTTESGSTDPYNVLTKHYFGYKQITPTFDGVTVFSQDANAPLATAGQNLVVSLHGSSGRNLTTGRQYRAQVSGLLAYDTHTEFAFNTVKSSFTNTYLLRPVDNYGIFPGNSTNRESMWLGFKNIPDATVALITERRLDAMLSWAKTNLTNVTHSKLCLTGGSMGGWGTLTFGTRRPNKFAALYPDRPRWRYAFNLGFVAVADWNDALRSVAVASAPNLRPEDGGGSVAQYMDITSYVMNTENKIPWIGWCIGRNDGFVQFSDHVDAVNALRSAKRGFAFAWNNGDHGTGSILSEILQSYPYGTFEIGKGYPLFTNHSGDKDPAVDLVGGINIGLSFRNVVESASSWSCEVTSVLGARTVTVEPISDIFNATVSPANVTIPAANTWVAVLFNA